MPAVMEEERGSYQINSALTSLFLIVVLLNSCIVWCSSALLKFYHFPVFSFAPSPQMQGVNAKCKEFT